MSGLDTLFRHMSACFPEPPAFAPAGEDLVGDARAGDTAERDAAGFLTMEGGAAAGMLGHQGSHPSARNPPPSDMDASVHSLPAPPDRCDGAALTDEQRREMSEQLAQLLMLTCRERHEQRRARQAIRLERTGQNSKSAPHRASGQTPSACRPGVDAAMSYAAAPFPPLPRAARQPWLASETARQPMSASEAARHPWLASEAARQPWFASEAARRLPWLASEAARQPMSASEAQPTPASDTASELAGQPPSASEVAGPWWASELAGQPPSASGVTGPWSASETAGPWSASEIAGQPPSASEAQRMSASDTASEASLQPWSAEKALQPLSASEAPAFSGCEAAGPPASVSEAGRLSPSASEASLQPVSASETAGPSSAPVTVPQPVTVSEASEAPEAPPLLASEEATQPSSVDETAWEPMAVSEASEAQPSSASEAQPSSASETTGQHMSAPEALRRPVSTSETPPLSTTEAVVQPSVAAPETALQPSSAGAPLQNPSSDASATQYTCDDTRSGASVTRKRAHEEVYVAPEATALDSIATAANVAAPTHEDPMLAATAKAKAWQEAQVAAARAAAAAQAAAQALVKNAARRLAVADDLPASLPLPSTHASRPKRLGNVMLFDGIPYPTAVRHLLSLRAYRSCIRPRTPTYRICSHCVPPISDWRTALCHFPWATHAQAMHIAVCYHIFRQQRKAEGNFVDTPNEDLQPAAAPSDDHHTSSERLHGPSVVGVLTGMAHLPRRVRGRQQGASCSIAQQPYDGHLYVGFMKPQPLHWQHLQQMQHSPQQHMAIQPHHHAIPTHPIRSLPEQQSPTYSPRLGASMSMSIEQGAGHMMATSSHDPPRPQWPAEGQSVVPTAACEQHQQGLVQCTGSAGGCSPNAVALVPVMSNDTVTSDETGSGTGACASAGTCAGAALTADAQGTAHDAVAQAAMADQAQRQAHMLQTQASEARRMRDHHDHVQQWAGAAVAQAQARRQTQVLHAQPSQLQPAQAQDAHALAHQALADAQHFQQAQENALNAQQAQMHTQAQAFAQQVQAQAFAQQQQAQAMMQQQALATAQQAQAQAMAHQETYGAGERKPWMG